MKIFYHLRPHAVVGNNFGQRTSTGSGLFALLNRDFEQIFVSKSSV